MKRFLKVGIIFGFLVIIIVVISWFVFPAWQNPASGGFLSLLGATLVGVLTFLQGLVSIWKDLKEEQKSTSPTLTQSIRSQQGKHVYNAPGGTINVVQKGAEELKSTTVPPVSLNLNHSLRITIDSDSDLVNHEEYVIIDNGYDNEEIQDMYAILNSVKIVEFYDKKTQEKRGRSDYEDDIQRGLKWKTNNGMQNYISLKPHQTGSLLLIKNAKFPDFLRFEIEEISKESYSNILYDNEWYDDGYYRAIIDIYGRKRGETQYSKRSFAVFVDFKRGQSAEIGGCHSG